jgi:hypothetical protein
VGVYVYVCVGGGGVQGQGQVCEMMGTMIDSTWGVMYVGGWVGGVCVGGGGGGVEERVSVDVAKRDRN